MDSEQAVTRNKKMVVEQVKPLIDNGQYLDALRTAEGEWGRYAGWNDPEQIRLLSKLLRHLGRPRSAEYLTLKLWRQNPCDNGAAFQAFFYFLSKKGAIYCHRFLMQWRELATEPSEVSDWMVVEAIFHAQMRDFATSHQLLDEAMVHSESMEWLTRIRIRVLEDEGKREEAYQLAEKHYTNSKTLPALESLVTLTKLYKGKQAASSLLKPIVEQFQSASLWLDYAILCFDNADIPTCEKALAQMAVYTLPGSVRSDDFVQYLKADIALHHQDVKMAVEELQSARTPFNKIFKTNVERISELKPVFYVDVPDIAQKHMTCAPSSLASVAQFWGVKVSEDEIAELICYGGTPEESQREWLINNGFAFLEFDLDEQATIDVISAGIPFTLVTTQGMSSHLQVVRGYDPNSGLLYLMDPSNTGNRKALLKETIECDALTGPKCVAIVPVDKKEKLSELTLPTAPLYPIWRKLELAYEKEDATMLNRHLQALEAIDQDHRMVHLGRRLSAILSRDDHATFELNSVLMERYPGVVYLIRSQYQCLYSLRGEKPAIDWLTEQYQTFGHSDIFAYLLAATDKKPEYRELRLSLFKQGENAVWGNAEFFWHLGHAAWEDLEKELACQYYFWAVCLDHINPAYIRSYFLAFRQLGRTEEALHVLKTDFERSIVASPSPAYSLYYAYEMDNKMDLAFEVFSKASEKHPDDPSLHHLYLEKLLDYGALEAFEQWFERKKQVLDTIDRLRLQAAKESRLGNNLMAIKSYARLVENPASSIDDFEGYLSILNRTGMADEADDILEKRRERSPDNSALIWTCFYMHSKEANKIGALKDLLKKFPNDVEANGKLAEYYLDKEEHEKAKSILDQLAKDHPHSVEVWLQVARYHTIHCQWLSAQEVACKSYQLNPNHDRVTDSVVRSHIGPKDRRRAFAFMAEELRKSGDVSDGILNFWHYADGWLPLGELRHFCEEMLALHSETWSVWLVRVLQHKSENEIDEALALVSQCSEKFSLVPRVFYEKAQLHLIKKDTESAIQAYETALTLSPGWSTAARAYHDLLENLGDVKRGLAVLEKCKSHNPYDASLFGYIAYCYKELGRDERAIELVEQALNIDVDYLWAWRSLKSWTEKGERYHQLLKAKKEGMGDRSEIYLVESQLVETYDEKKRCLEKSLSLSPTCINSHIQYVDLLMEHREDTLAIKQIEAEVWKGSPPITIAIKRAEIYARWGEMGEAMTAISDLLLENPRYVEAWNLKLDWATQVNSRSEIIEAIEALETLCPHDPDILVTCAKSYKQLDCDKYEAEVNKLFENAYSLAPSNADAAFSLCDFYLSLGWLDKAQHQLFDMTRFHESPWLEVRRLELALRSERYSSVLEHFERVLLCGEDTEWLYAYSLYIIKQSDLELYRKLIGLTKANLAHTQLDPSAATAWTEEVMSTRAGIDLVCEVLSEYDLTDAVWKAIAIEYLHGIPKYSQYPKEDFWHKFETLTDQYPEMINARCQVLFLLDRRYELGTYMRQIQAFDNPHVSAVSFYFLAYVSAEMKDYQMVKQAVEMGLSQTPDNSFDRLCLWRMNIAMRENRPIDFADLNRVNIDKLSGEEKTIIRLLKIAAHCHEKAQQGLPLNGQDVAQTKYLDIQSSLEHDAKKALISYIVKLKQLKGISKLLERFILHRKIK